MCFGAVHSGQVKDESPILLVTQSSLSVDLMMTKEEDENNNQTDSDSVLTLYVRAGCDNRKYGACPFCQRIFMLLMLKSQQGGKQNLKIEIGPKNRIYNQQK